MTAWSTDELERLGGAKELRVAGLRADGSLRDLVVIWAVRAGDEVFVRSVRGATGAWYRGVLVRHEGRIESGGVEKDVAFEHVPVGDPANDRIDSAYADKYGAGSRSVRAITSPAARETTLRVLPR